MSAAFDTSQLIAATLRPGALAWILDLASASVPGSRARIATSAPDLAYSSAIARPSPLLPPVTTALLPSSLTSISSLLPRVAPAVRRSADRSPASLRLSSPSELLLDRSGFGHPGVSGRAVSLRAGMKNRFDPEIAYPVHNNAI